MECHIRAGAGVKVNIFYLMIAGCSDIFSGIPKLRGFWCLDGMFRRVRSSHLLSFNVLDNCLGGSKYNLLSFGVAGCLGSDRVRVIKNKNDSPGKCLSLWEGFCTRER